MAAIAAAVLTLLTAWITEADGVGPGQRAFNISSISVPAQAIAEAEVECRYDADFTVLKWWKGRQEFFRYRPGGAPSTRSFPALGVGAVETLACGPTACKLRLTGLTEEATGAYRCDIEREKPPYRFAARASHMTVAGFGSRRPTLAGVAEEYGAGETVDANCAGSPDSKLRWYVNGQEHGEGSTLRLEVTRLQFMGSRAEISVQCAEFDDGGKLLGSTTVRARWRDARSTRSHQGPEEQRASAAAPTSAVVAIFVHFFCVRMLK